MNPFKKAGYTTWCPGCGNFGILKALEEVLEEEGLAPHEVLVVSGIGQAAKLPHYIKAHGLNTLHGRALPAAIGAHLANHELKIIVASGDGDTYGEGGNHWIHAIRRNANFLHLVHNNQIYGLTKGQGSPTTAKGQKTSMDPKGVKPSPMNPITTAIAMGAGFVARSFSGDKEHLKAMIKAGLDYEGYALIDILQPCVSFNKVNTYQWYKENSYLLEDHDPHNKGRAFELGDQESLALGVIYKNPRETMLEAYPQISKPLVKRDLSPEDIKKLYHKHK